MQLRNRIRREIEALRESPPGRRFVDGHERHRIANPVLRLSLLLGGVVITLVAMATFWLPGPNFVLVLVGLLLIAGQWRLIARIFDRMELLGRALREQWWEPYPHKRLAIWSAAILVLLLIALVLYGSWRLGLLPDGIPGLG